MTLFSSVTRPVLLLALVFGSAFSGAQAAAGPKRGVAYGYHSAADLRVLAPGVSWWYNWAPVPETGAAGVYQSLGFDYVPMQWNDILDGSTVTAERLAARIPVGTRYLLGFNEPNFRSQANLTPRRAAAIWPVLEEVARRKNLKLVSPAVNYCGDCVSDDGVTYYSPTQYLDAFFAACPNCQVDYVALHTYVCEEQYLREKVAELKKYNRPIWLTEFACGDRPANQITAAVQQKYQLDAVNYLEKEPAIFRYAWFSGRNAEIPNINLLGADGQLTTLGRQYVSRPAGWEPGQLRPVAVTASSREKAGTDAGNVTDQNINTRWASQFTDPQVIQLDLGSLCTVSRVLLTWETAYAKDYKLEISTDGTTWKSLRTVTDSDGGVDDLTDLSGLGRYLRLTGTRRATAYGYSLYEIETFGTNLAAPMAVQTAMRPSAAFDLYPNPAETTLYLRLPDQVRARSVAVFDGLGRLVLTAPAETTDLNVAALVSGFYSVRITTTDQRQLTQQFLKR